MKKILSVFIICFLISGFSKKMVTWVAIGDSITYLNDHQDQTGNRVIKGYMSRAVEEFPGMSYLNKGYNGWTAARIAGNIHRLGLVKADFYSIFLGTNDWWQGKPVGTLEDYKNNTGNNTFYGSIRIILDKVDSLNKKAPVILITPMQRVDFVSINNPKNRAYGSYKAKDGQQLEAFADAIITIGKYEKIPVVDLYHKEELGLSNLVKYKRLKDPQTGAYKNYPFPEFMDVSFNPETDAYPYPPESMNMTYDGLHPSDTGYAIISNMISDVLRKEKKLKKVYRALSNSKLRGSK